MHYEPIRLAKKKNKFKCNWGHWSIHYNVLIDECANSQIESAKVT